MFWEYFAILFETVFKVKQEIECKILLRFLNVKQMLFKKFDKGIEDGKFYFYWFKLYMIICIIFFFYKNKEIKN